VQQFLVAVHRKKPGAAPCKVLHMQQAIADQLLSFLSCNGEKRNSVLSKMYAIWL